MIVVCAPDSFKESLTAAQAAIAMARGVRRADPDATCVEVPMSDGGEGFADSLAAALGAEVVRLEVPDALGRPVVASYALAGGLAVIEVAQAVGLALVAPPDRDLWRATSVGVGHLITDALDHGATRIVVGLGGTATNDGGAGMLTALGVRFLSGSGDQLAPTPQALCQTASVDRSALDPRLAEVRIEAACDVGNPLYGPSGASAVYGPQKGATDTDVPQLDAVLRRLAEADPTAAAAAHLPGAGAAGGLGWALLAYLGAAMRPGVELVAETIGLAAAVAGADLVLTGEGSVDAQTLQGKTPAGVAAVAALAGVPVVVLAGRVATGADVLYDHGVTALVPIVQGVTTLDRALASGAENLEQAAETVTRLWLAARRER